MDNFMVQGSGKVTQLLQIPIPLRELSYNRSQPSSYKKEILVFSL